jgi:coenzyme F420-reducing hydrogenase delta subunit/ferredoxin
MYEPKIIAFLCTWCSYTGADTAGIARLKSPANLRTVRVPCSGRVSPELIMRTFDQGADGVLVLGCHIGECHYDSGNHRTAKRLPVLKTLLNFAGLEEERLRLDWVSASEGDRFSRIVTDFVDTVRALGPVRWRVDKQEFKPSYQRAPSLHPSPHTSFSNATLEQQTLQLRQTAQELLGSGQAACVIGYEQDWRGRTRPTFVYRPEDTNRLVWNQDCTHNLTGYLNHKLLQLPQAGNGQTINRVAVVVKACDSRSIHVQLAEKSYTRDQVYIIGMACEGIQEQARYDGRVHTQQESVLQQRCIQCTDRNPVISDILIGELKKEAPISAGISNRNLTITQLAAMTPSERMDFWLGEFDRCIRCYACRQACPMCDCPTCLYERDDSLWVGAAHGWEGVGLNEKRTFHLGRAYHLAGRCIGCDECERACPMGIPISYLNQMLSQEMERSYNHRAGVTIIPTPLVTILSGEEGVQ